MHANGLSVARNKKGSSSILISLHFWQGRDPMGNSVIINYFMDFFYLLSMGRQARYKMVRNKNMCFMANPSCSIACLKDVNILKFFL